MWRIWAAALLWGLNWPVIKVLLTGAGPWTLRTVGLGGGTLLLAIATVASGQSLTIRRRDWPGVVLAGLLAVAGFNLFSVYAQMTLTASRAAILTYTMPLWSILFARLILGEPIDRIRWISLTVGAMGIALLAAPLTATLADGTLPVGLLYVLAAAISWAAGTIVLKKLKPAGDPLALTTWQFAVGAVVVTAGLIAFEAPHLELRRPEILACLAYNVIFPQAVAYGLWFSLITRVNASTAALGTLLVPVTAVAASSLWLGERLGALDWAGFTLILAAVTLDQGLRSRQMRASPADQSTTAS
jgi:drug/metabolite transporter (DMT)-like permease